MTITLSYKRYPMTDRYSLFIERYADKPYFTPFWRYGIVDEQTGHATPYSGMLFSRPAPKRCMERLKGMV